MLEEWRESFDFILKFEQEYDKVIHIQCKDIIFQNEKTFATLFERLELPFELDENQDIVKDTQHHFERQYLSKDDIKQIESEVDVKGYAEYIETKGIAAESLKHLPQTLY